MQGSARKDVVFGAAGVYPVTVPGPKWKSWLIVTGTARQDVIVGSIRLGSEGYLVKPLDAP